jgi:NAD(P)-dependent dehydrogenase (short-subunit alcohol dehydrogenase family)
MSFLKKAGKELADVIPGLGEFTFDEDLGTVFVTSGTGVIGHRVALSLLEAGHRSVRVGIWKSDREIGGDKSMGQKVAEELAARGADVVDFDWSDEDDFASAVAGVRTVFCTMPHMDLGTMFSPRSLALVRRLKWSTLSKFPSSRQVT